MSTPDRIVASRKISSDIYELKHSCSVGEFPDKSIVSPISKKGKAFESSNTSKNPCWPNRLEYIKQVLTPILENRHTTIFFLILTIWVLFDVDIRIVFTEKSTDIIFEVINSFAFFAFLFEMIANCICTPNYMFLPDWTTSALPSHNWFQVMKMRLQFGSFQFWMDTVATTSLMIDIQWLLGDIENMSYNNLFQDSRASRAARLAGRATRLVDLYHGIKADYYGGQDQSHDPTLPVPETPRSRSPSQSSSLHDSAAPPPIDMTMTTTVILPPMTHCTPSSPEHTHTHTPMSMSMSTSSLAISMTKSKFPWNHQQQQQQRSEESPSPALIPDPDSTDHTDPDPSDPVTVTAATAVSVPMSPSTSLGKLSCTDNNFPATPSDRMLPQETRIGKALTDLITK
eukprot:gene10754-22468_t